jgi:predicted TIM-barrel fold metal-dependent hydrolase
MDAHPRVHVDLSYLACNDGLERFVRRYGADRVVMATGAPAKDHRAPWFVLEHSDLSDDERRLVGGGTAARLLGLDDVNSTVPSAPTPQAPAIDFHAHIGAWPSSWMPATTHEAVLRSAVRVGIVHSVISHLEGIWVDARHGNERAIAAARQHPEALSVHLVANPHFADHAEVLRDQLADPVVRGIKVHPDTHFCPIDDERYGWIWQLAVETNTPVLSHGFGGSPWSDPSRFGVVAERFPDLRLVIGHSGANIDGFRATIEVAQRHPNLMAEICGSWLTGRWLSTLVRELGAERVLFGTDSCLIDPRYSRGRVESAELSQHDEYLVLVGNAARLLGLSSTPLKPTP